MLAWMTLCALYRVERDAAVAGREVFCPDTSLPCRSSVAGAAGDARRGAPSSPRASRGLGGTSLPSEPGGEQVTAIVDTTLVRSAG